MADMVSIPSDEPRAGLVSGEPCPAYPRVVDRITVNPKQMGGMPCIRGLRIPVATVVGMIADGMSAEEVLAELPALEREDVQAALRYAADTLAEHELPLRPSA